MESPDRTRKASVWPDMSPMPPQEPTIRTISHDMARTTTVRIAVARFESTSLMPILAKMEVKAAKMADRKAKTIHITGWTEYPDHI